MKNTNEMNEFVNRNSLVEGQSKDNSRLSTLNSRLSTFTSRLSTFNSQLSTLVLFVFCLFFSATVWGQSTTLTVYGDNTTTNEYVPIYGYWSDSKSKCEFIIPAEKLSAMNGGNISAMKFYLSSSGNSNQISATFDVFVKEVDATTLTAYTGNSGATTVYNQTITINTNASNVEYNIPFSSDYSYNGRNLLIGFYQTGSTSYNHIYWVGESQTTNTAWYGYGDGAGSASQFLPKTTFTYTIPTVCLAPSDLSYTEVTDNSVTLRWADLGTATQWWIFWDTQEYAAANPSWRHNTGFISPVDKTYTITGLNPGTNYRFRIFSVCGEGDYPTCSCPDLDVTTLCTTPTDLAVTNVSATTASLDWTGTNGDYVVMLKEALFFADFETTDFSQGDFEQDGSYPFDVVELDGNYVAKSSNGGVGSSTSYMELQVDLPQAATLSFNYLCQGEGTSTFWDHCDFEIDGEVQFTHGADLSGWQTYEVLLQSGQHTLKWSYTKDDSVDPTGDCFYVDDIIISSGTWSEVGTPTESAYTINNLSPETTYLAKVKRVCEDCESNESDIVTFTTLEGSCPKPISLTAGTPGPRSVQLSWTAQGTETQWQICVNGNESNPTLVSENPYTLGGLTPETTYTVKVRAYCDASEQSNWSNEISFTTDVACPVPTDLDVTNLTPTSATLNWTGSADSYNVRYRIPAHDEVLFFDGFESGDLSNWETYATDYTSSETDWNVYDFGSYSYEGNYVAWSRSWDGSEPHSVQNWLITPQVTLDGFLSFYMIDDGTYHEQIYVLVSTGGEYSMLAEQPGQASDSWTEFTADLRSYAGQQGRIAIFHEDYDKNYIAIDNFRIYRPVAEGSWIETTSSENSITINNLTSGLEYEWQVQADCGGDGESSWSAISNFTTPSPCDTPIGLTAEVACNSAALSWSDYTDTYNVRYREVEPTAPATIILNVPSDIWGDGTGYQLILDADHNTYGNTIPTSGNFTAGSFSGFEYTVPENAECNASTNTIVVNGSATITIPAGVYDYVFLNPDPSSGTYYIASNNGFPGRGDDYEFEAGMTYEFVLSVDNNDYITANITDNNSWTLVEGVSNPYTLQNLNYETTYKVQVQGANCDGNGATSDWSTATTFTTPVARTLTINYTYSGGGQAAATHTETLCGGASYSVASPSITGYTPSQATVSGTMPDSDVTVNVTYTINSHTVTYAYTGTVPAGAPAVPASQTYNYGAIVPAASVPTLEGYTFHGWTGEVSTMPDNDVNVTGYWTVNSYTVTYAYTGTVPAGAPAVPTSQTYNYGATVPAASVPTLTGYTFSGWSGEVSTMPAHDVNVTGSWTINHYTLTIVYEYADHSTASATHTEEVNYNASYSVESPSITGYTPNIAVVSGTMGTSAVTVTVTYNINSHNVTYAYTGDVPAGAPAVPATVSYNYGATVSAAAVPTLEGYTFHGWTGEVSTMPDNDVNVTGYWTVNSYTVTYAYTGTVPAGAPAVPTSRTYNYGATVPAASVPSLTGYTFSGWSGEVSTMPAHDVNVTGSWTINHYTLTIVYEYADHSTASATHTEEVNYNASYSVESPSITGYTPNIAVVSGTMGTSDVTVTVTYSVNSYTLTINYEYADHTTASETYTASVNYNASYSVNSPNINCYTPNQATVSGTMPADNVTVTVTYNIINYVITATADAGGSVSGGNTYNCGAMATLRATPDDGYCFSQWSDGVTDNPRSVTVNGAASYTANFTHYLEVSNIANVDYCVTGAHAAVSATPTAGSGDYTYTWQKYNGSSWVAAPDASSSDRYTPPYTTTGTVSYRVSVADNNGCAGHNSVVKEFSVKVSDVPSIALSASPVCSGSTLTLEPSVENNGKDVSSSSYQISANNSDWSSFTNGSAVTNEQNGYYIKYTATNGCGSSSQTVQITVNSLPTASIDGPTSVCALKSETIVASGAGDGGSYSWSNDLGTGASKTVAITSNANYTVTVTDANGCKDEETISMTVTVPGNQPMTHAPEHGAIWTGYESADWSDVNNWVYFDGNYRTLEGLSDTLNLILRTGDSDKCILNNPVISSPSFASNSGMIVRRPITIGEGTALNIGGDLNVESGSITLSSTGALLVTGNANIASGASVAFDNKDTLSIAGNLVLEGTLDFPESDTTPALRLGGNLVIDGGSIEEGGTLVFAGSGTQNVSNGASPLTLNNNVRLNMHRSRAGVPHTVFPDGTIFSKTTIFEYGIMDGNVTFDATGRTIVCGGYESYASGTVTKIGAGNNFTFPTGDDNVLGSITAKIALEQNAVAKFHHNSSDNGDGTHGFTTEVIPRWWNAADMCGRDPFDHVSNFEYWDFNSSAALSGVMFRTAAATAGEHFHSPSEYPDPENPGNVIQVAVYDECWKNAGGELSITSDFTEITISNVGVEARGTRGSAITSLGSKSKTIVLPIELTSFTATCDGRSALVEWTTATEKNNDYFSLERSDDAINFTEIARIAGAGNSIEPLDYSYTDYGIHGGDNYYRLVQVDYDGTRTVSEVIVANCIEPEVGEPDVQAYPNPFNGELTLVLDNFSNRAATIEIYDMLGKLIYTEKASAPQNSYETILNLSNLPSGAYTVRVSTTDFVINKNVVKN